MTQTPTQTAFLLTNPQSPNPDLPPQPRPEETPAPVDPGTPDAPIEQPGTPAPDLPPEGPPSEVPTDPQPTPGPDLPGPTPDETPVPGDPDPSDAPLESPGTPAPDLPPETVPDELPSDLPATTPPAEVRLRPGRPLDAGRLGEMITASVENQPWMPRLHTGAEDIAFAGRMVDNGWVTVAEIDGQPAGFLAREGSYIHSLYIAPFAQGQGAGQALIADAKQRCETLDLWTFQANRGAQRFYKREGFEPVQETDGRTNDEGLPDVHFRWQAAPRPSPAPKLTLPTEAAVKAPARG